MALNGQFPSTMLAYLGWPEADHLRLVPAAAASLTRLAAKFERDHGKPLYVTDAYRTLASQVSLKISKSKFAATPGTSNHGLGLATDLASRINVEGSLEHLWMEVHGPTFGWINPAWATNYDPRDGQHEPWHWEYHAGLDRSTDAPIAQAAPTPAPTPPALIPEDDMARLVKHPNGSLAIAGPGAEFTILSTMTQVDTARGLGQVTGPTIELADPLMWDTAVTNAARRRDQN